MPKMSSHRWIVLALILFGLGGLARADGPRRPVRTDRGYVTIPFQGNLELMLKDQLRRAKNLESLGQLLKNLNIDPKKLPIDSRVVENLEAKELQDMVKEWKEKAPVPLEQLKALEKALEKEIARQQDQSTPQPESNVEDTPSTGDSPTGEEGLEDQFSRWLQDRVRGLESSRLADLLRLSPAFQRGLEDLQLSVENRVGGNDMLGLGKLVERLRQSGQLDFSSLHQGFDKVAGWKLPSGLLVDGLLPKLGNPLRDLSLPKWRLPRQLPISPGAILGVIGAGLLFLSWQLFRPGRRRSATSAGWNLGPWPVDPARVSSGAELIAAFEYLALLLLGPPARAWNHRAIAERLGATATGQGEQRRRAAHTLADLYELARYAPNEGPLEPDALADARRDLCFLAGVAMS
jgi:hypothetical protein